MKNQMGTIIGHVADFHGISVQDLVGPCRIRDFVYPRQDAYWLASKATGLSLPLIGKAIGNRDHTTVLHGIRGAEERAKKCPMYQQQLNEMLDGLPPFDTVSAARYGVFSTSRAKVEQVAQ